MAIAALKEELERDVKKDFSPGALVEIAPAGRSRRPARVLAKVTGLILLGYFAATSGTVSRDPCAPACLLPTAYAAEPSLAEGALTPPVAAPEVSAEAAALATPSRRTLTADELSEALKQGDMAFVKGDVIAARRFYQIGADAGDGRAALRLAETFDHLFLNIVTADRSRAAYWYRKARDLGNEEANILLQQLGASDIVPKAGPSANPGPTNEKGRSVEAFNGPGMDAIKADIVVKPVPSGVADTSANPSSNLSPIVPKEAVPRANNPVAPAAVPIPMVSNPRSLSAGELSALLGRGDTLLGIGDVAAARLFYERGAAAGDGTAALRLGETFDPRFLAGARLGLVTGDPARAAQWYARAQDLGNADAAALLQVTEAIKK